MTQENKVFTNKKGNLEIHGTKEFQESVIEAIFSERYKSIKEDNDWIDEHKNTVFFEKLKELFNQK